MIGDIIFWAVFMIAIITLNENWYDDRPIL